MARLLEICVDSLASARAAIRGGADIKSTRHLVEKLTERIHVSDTDKGRDIRRRIESLRKLLYAYQQGIIKEMGK